MTSAPQLFSTLDPPYLVSTTYGLSELTNISRALERRDLSGGVIRFLRGEKMRTPAALFDEIAAALQFPYYFGENWAALDECIQDLDWLPGRGYLFIILQSHIVLRDGPEEDFAVFLRILDSACRFWAKGDTAGPWDKPPTPCHVIMQCAPEEEPALIARAQSAGHTISRLPAAWPPS